MIIGLGGKARVGKDSIAEVFTKTYGFTKINFADALKMYCAEAFNIPLKFCYDDTLKDAPLSKHLTTDVLRHFLALIEVSGGIPTSHVDLSAIELIEFISPRHILQYMGTDVARKVVSDDVWLKIFQNRVLQSEGHVVCADVRFINEVKLIRSLEGHALYVIRPQVTGAVRSHSSEELTEDDFDVIIDNSGDLLTTQSDVRMWMSRRFPGGLR
jgi:hypothetical protein